MIDFQPTFFSWGNAQNEGMGIPPLPTLLATPVSMSVMNIAKETMQIPEIEIVSIQKKKSDVAHKRELDNAKKLKELASAIETIVALSETYGTATKGTLIAGKAAGHISVLTDLTINLIEYSDGTVSRLRASYRIGGVLTSTVIGTAVGGPLGFVAGILIGAAFNETEKAYDIIAPQILHDFNHDIQSIKNSISRYH